MPLACLPRSASALIGAIEGLNVATNPRFARRPIGGKMRTFCNQFVEAVCLDLEAALPAGYLARQQIDWLNSDAGKAAGWRKCETSADACTRADAGFPTLACWRNRDDEASSHIAVLVPAVGSDPRIAQAGRTNFSNGTLRAGFGDHAPILFFTHD